MRIGIDCRLSGNTHAGIGRYIENLIVRLPQLSTDIIWVFFFHNQKQVPLSLTKATNVQLIFAPFRHYTLAEQLHLPRIFSQARLDLLHVPHFNIPLGYRGPLVVTIHDLLWHERRGASVTTLHPLMYWFKYFAYRMVATQAIQRAHAIFVPAQTVKKTLIRYYPTAEKKVIVTKEGVSGEFTRVATRLDKNIPPKLVYVGSLYPHKNLNVVLQALKKLPHYHLDVVGSRNVFQEQIKTQVQQLGITQQVTFHGYVPDKELTTLLAQTTALVQPSLSEGFGLTGLEAMAAGVPVIASDIPIFKEIYQDGAIYFDPHSSESFVSAVGKLEKSSRAALRHQGQAVAAHYSWDTMANITLESYLKIAKSR